jgi:acyl-CoA thioesterase FadM
MKYTDKHKVMSQFTDKNGILKTGALLRYMQEAAANCMLEDGPSYDELLDLGYSFVLSKITLSVYADIHSNDEIEVETWACESSRYSFPRCYRVTRAGVTVAEASSIWALVNTKTRRLVRSGDVELSYRTDEPLELDAPSKLRMPTDSFSLVGERQVRYSDIDKNGHMNNTVYADMICDYVFSHDIGRICSLCISFQNEALFGEVLKVYKASEDDTFYIRTVREDTKINVEAEVIIEKID